MSVYKKIYEAQVGALQELADPKEPLSAEYLRGATWGIYSITKELADVLEEVETVTAPVEGAASEQHLETAPASDPVPAPEKKKRKRGGGRKPKVNEDELWMLWCEGKRTQELATKYGVSAQTINKYITKLSIQDRIERDKEENHERLG